MTKGELIYELVKARVTEARLKKRVRGEKGWFGNHTTARISSNHGTVRGVSSEVSLRGYRDT